MMATTESVKISGAKSWLAAGNIGSERKIEFTVIGNAVNLAQRVESIAGRGQVFLRQGTFEEARERAFVFRMPDCPVKNVAKPIQVYSLRGIVPPALQGNPSAGEVSGQTSRRESAVEEMLFSLPCVLSVENVPPVSALVTHMAFERDRKQSRIQCAVERPLAQGTAVKLLWNLPEKPSLLALDCTVEHSWTPSASSPTPAPAAPAEPAALGAPPKIAPEHGTSLIDVSAVEGTLTLLVTKVPDELLAFRAGSCLESDLKSMDQIIRA